MIDEHYIKQPRGIPFVSFNSVFNFKEKTFVNPYGIHNGDEIIFTHMHNHKDFEIIVINEGEGVFQVNDRVFEIKAGDVIMINPYDIHSGHMKKTQDIFSYTCVDFDAAFLKDDKSYSAFADSLIKGSLKYRYHLTPPVSNEISAYVRQADYAYENGFPGWELTVKASLLLIFSVLMKNGLTEKSEIPKENAFILAVLDYIDKNYSENLNSDNVSAALSYNQSYFCRLFKKHFNCSFGEYLNIYRIKKAEELLANQELKVSDVAYSVGFNNLSYFSKVFLALTGSTPSEYRKKTACR